MSCEAPRLSRTRICANDFGSALSALSHIRSHDSIFHLAGQVAGLHLKPAKCVLVVTGVPLTDSLKEAIREWFRNNVPRFAEFTIADCGKYLGVWLGRNLVKNTLQGPLEKYNNRVTELLDAHPPGPVAIFRYSEYVASVFSYVAQFLYPDFPKEFQALEHRSILRLLRMSGNDLPRCLTLTLKEFLGVEPRPILHSFLGVLSRYAMSEQDYFISLAKEISSFLSDANTVLDRCRVCPTGGLDSTPILQRLFDAMSGQGVHANTATIWGRLHPSTSFLG